jgi:diacylglycerol kinase family enzyme
MSTVSPQGQPLTTEATATEAPAADREELGSLSGLLTERRRFARGERTRMLLIVNPMATTVSSRLRNLIVHALRGRYEVEAAETEGPNHATELGRQAVADEFDLVVAFGGDGTVNEAANGLAGSKVALSVLPGGCTNVVCRMLCIPTDVIDATEHLLGLADELEPRSIDLGSVNGRYFVSSGGVGLDAETTRWVDDHAPLKRRAGPFFFSAAGALSYGRYLRRPARIAVEAGGRRVEGASAVVQNSDPYTFFNSRPIRLCEGEALASGTFALVVLRSVRRRDVPGLTYRLLSARPITGHRQIESFPSLQTARVTALDHGPQALDDFPIQVDGDYIGHFTEAEFRMHPDALRVVA